MKINLKYIIVAFAALAFNAVPAFGQTQPSVRQQGTVTTNHTATWCGNNCIKDGGGAGGGSVTNVAASGDNVLFATTISGSPITVSGTFAFNPLSHAGNLVYVTPNGTSGTPTFRALAGGDLPLATASTFGVVDVPINGGLNLTSGSLSLSAPTTSVLGGVKALSGATSNSFVTFIDTSGVQHVAQPSFSNLTGTAAIAQGGTGQTAFGAANSCLQTNGSVTGTVWGSCVGTGTGTVTSVSMTATGMGVTITGSPITTIGTLAVSGQWNASAGGTGIDTSASTGVPHIVSGTWSVLARLTAALGGTGIDTSASTGVAQIASGTWSASTALANGTTVTTQAANDNSTKAASTAYVDQYAPRWFTAYAAFSGTATGTNAPNGDSFNIASITRVSAGLYTVNFTSSLGSSNYVVTCTAQTPDANARLCYLGTSARSASSFQVIVATQSATATDATEVFVHVSGN